MNTANSPESFNTNSEKITSLPTSSPNSHCNFYLKEIERSGHLNDIKDFLNDTEDRDFHKFENPLDRAAFEEAYDEFIKPSLSDTDKEALFRYTGYDYKRINQVARGFWDYETLGAKTPERVASAERTINDLHHAIGVSPAPEVDLVTYRGTNLDSFHGYNINSLSDLKSLEGQFFVEAGFTSTSISPDGAFTKKNLDDPLRRECNIEITCKIPKESRETIGLFSSDLSSAPKQDELLIDAGALFYVSGASISPDRSSATLEMTLVPRELYDKNAYHNIDAQ